MRFLRVRSSGLRLLYAEAHRKLEHDDRIRSETAQYGRHGRVEAGEDGGHADDRPGPDDHAQHRQEGAHFVRPDGLQRQKESVDECQFRHGLSFHPQGFDRVEFGGAWRAG